MLVNVDALPSNVAYSDVFVAIHHMAVTLSMPVEVEIDGVVVEMTPTDSPAIKHAEWERNYQALMQYRAERKTIVTAVAESWASIDGKLSKFEECRDDPSKEETGGYYGGYMCEAEELLVRMERRGVIAIAKPLDQ